MAYLIPVKHKNTSVPSGNTVLNSNSEVLFASNVVIPANSLVAGDVWRLTLYGVYSVTGLAPTLTGKLKFGSTIILNSGALTTITGVTNGGWRAEAILIINSTGSSGAIEAQGFCFFSTAATASLNVALANTAAVTIDTTVNQTVQTSVQWSTADNGNTITLRQMILEKIN